MARITISKLNRPEPAGDWHDKPLRWKVTGPVGEIQKFTTKSDARLYAKLRRKALSFLAALREFYGSS